MATATALAGDRLAASVEYCGRDGARRRELLARCWPEAFEDAAPVRGFPSYRGQRSWPGAWWFSRTGQLVGYESWVERDVLMALDADPDVVAVSSQPMWLDWLGESGKPLRHAPDFFARRADGAGVLIDVRPDGRVRSADAAVFADTAVMAARVGWEYLRVGELDAVTAANLRWLSGYRHPRCAQPAVMDALREVFVEPTALRAGAAAVGDPVAVLPTLFAMLWRHELAADLDGARLEATSLVWTAGQAA